tara:strand:+ start:76 stop:633 length:558 start_codon:yes stop_codon:yes gene_type:complete
MESSFIKSIVNNLRGRSIFLIGMMGSGKSITGSKLAQYLNYKYIDVDNLIEQVSHKSINSIFEDNGEQFFRDIEKKCLQEIVKIHSTVVSTGGGVIETKENWGILRQGIVVWLDLDKKVAIERLRFEANNRPLLKDKDITKTYNEIFDSRKNLYSLADLRVKIYRENVVQVTEKILLEINRGFSN